MNPYRVLPRLCTLFVFAMFSTAELEAASGGWRSFYGAGGAGTSQKLAQDGEGNVYVGGSITENSGSRVSIVKYDSTGHRRWNFIYDSDADVDQFQNFAVAGNGQVYVAANRFTTN